MRRAHAVRWRIQHIDLNEKSKGKSRTAAGAVGQISNVLAHECRSRNALPAAGLRCKPRARTRADTLGYEAVLTNFFGKPMSHNRLFARQSYQRQPHESHMTQRIVVLRVESSSIGAAFPTALAGATALLLLHAGPYVAERLLSHLPSPKIFGEAATAYLPVLLSVCLFATTRRLTRQAN